jgi:two-component system, chemotaxis family, protein-glutamate methylesterase/glutaminase
VTFQGKENRKKTNSTKRKPWGKATRDIIVVGASAGGIQAFNLLLRELPSDLPAAILLTIHVSAQSPNMLPKIYGQTGTFRVVEKLEDGHPIQPGHLYIAPPDIHLLVEYGRVRLARGPKENRHRPAIDPMFRSAACVYGSRVIGVLLSGNLDDGTSGLVAIKECGGTTVVQDPEDALFPDMPRNALDGHAVDYCLPINQMSSLLTRLVAERPKMRKGDKIPRNVEIETSIAYMKPPSIDEMKMIGKPSAISCPECDGALWEIKEGNKTRFRCRVGHGYSQEALEEDQADKVENALWSAVRTLEERASILRGLAAEARKHNNPLTASVFEKKYQEIEPAAKTLRALLVKAHG